MDTIKIMLIVAVILVVVLSLVLYNFVDRLRRYKLSLALLERNLETEKNDKEFYIRESERNKKELEIVKEQAEKKYRNRKTIKIGKTSLVNKDTFKGMKVLVGDYNDDTIQNTRKVLMSLGFEVDTVESGDDIYDKITHGYTCDVIVTNNIYRYGKRHGIDVLNDLKDIEGFNIPIVVLTVSTGEREEFLNMGYDEYMEKILTQKQAEEVMTRLLLSKNDRGIKTKFC